MVNMNYSRVFLLQFYDTLNTFYLSFIQLLIAITSWMFCLAQIGIFLFVIEFTTTFKCTNCTQTDIICRINFDLS